MKFTVSRSSLLTALFLFGSWCSWSVSAAPGEDTIHLDGPVQYTFSPGPPLAPSGNRDSSYDVPAWMKARMSRYTAKAYSAQADDGTIFTDSDVVTTSYAEGFSKTCVQEVGSNVAASDGALGTRYGPNQREQVVVLKGDLVNICR